MALIQGPAYRSRRRMQRMTASGTMPSTERPSASSARTSELETGTWGPSTHSARQPGGTAGAAPVGRDTTARVTRRRRSSGGARSRARAPGRPRRRGRALSGRAARFRQDLLGGVHRVAGAAPLHFEPARLGARDLLGQELGQRVAVRRRRDRPLPRLLPGIVGHDKEEAVEAQLLDDGACRGHVPGMRRVEGAAEDPDAGRARQVPASSAITGASASISASCTTM